MSEIKPAHPIGKTQWSKWGDKARKVYNHCISVGFTFQTAVEEANAVQAKVRSAALDELAQLGQEMDAEGVAPPVADDEVAASPSPTASTPKKPRTPRKKKAE